MLPVRRKVAGLSLAALIALSAQCVVLCSVGLHCPPEPDQPAHSHCPHHPRQDGSACAHQQPFATGAGDSPLPILATSALAPAPTVPLPAGAARIALAGPADTGPPALTNPACIAILRV